MNNFKNICIEFHDKVREFIGIIINDKVSVNCGDDFSYSHIDNEIEYSLVVPEQGAGWFYNFVAERAISYNLELEDFDIFLVSLLHEVGHYFTFDFQIFDAYSDLREEYKKECSSAWPEEKEIIYNKYHNLPDELAATDWAIKFIIDNEEFCEKWNEIFCVSIQYLIREYEENN